MVTRILIAALSVVLALLPSLAQAQGLPSVPRKLVGHSGVVCVKLSEAGHLADAFVVISTGQPDTDRALVAWVSEIDWSAPDNSGAPRDHWFPLPVAFGEGEPPAPPAACGPTPAAWS